MTSQNESFGQDKQNYALAGLQYIFFLSVRMCKNTPEEHHFNISFIFISLDSISVQTNTQSRLQWFAMVFSSRQNLFCCQLISQPLRNSDLSSEFKDRRSEMWWKLLELLHLPFNLKFIWTPWHKSSTVLFDHSCEPWVSFQCGELRSWPANAAKIATNKTNQNVWYLMSVATLSKPEMLAPKAQNTHWTGVWKVLDGSITWYSCFW